MNLDEVSSALYNTGGIQQKAGRGKGQIKELNDLSLHSKRLIEVTCFQTFYWKNLHHLEANRMLI